MAGLPHRHRDRTLTQADAERQPGQAAADDGDMVFASALMPSESLRKRVGQKPWLNQPARSRNRHCASRGHRAGKVRVPAKPARTLTTTSWRVTRIAADESVIRLNTSGSPARRGSHAANSRVRSDARRTFPPVVFREMVQKEICDHRVRRSLRFFEPVAGVRLSPPPPRQPSAANPASVSSVTVFMESTNTASRRGQRRDRCPASSSSNVPSPAAQFDNPRRRPAPQSRLQQIAQYRAVIHDAIQAPQVPAGTAASGSSRGKAPAIPRSITRFTRNHLVVHSCRVCSFSVHFEQRSMATESRAERGHPP